MRRGIPIKFPVAAHKLPLRCSCSTQPMGQDAVFSAPPPLAMLAYPHARAEKASPPLASPSCT